MAHSLSPTTVLPGLATLHACNASRVGDVLQALRDIYFPHAPSPTAMGAVPVLKQSLSKAVPALRPRRMQCLVQQDGVPDSGYASAEEDDQDEQADGAKETDDEDMIDADEELDVLRANEHERGYAIKWLTGLVKRGDSWVCGTTSSSLSSEEQELRTMRLEDASRLLARFAGDDAPEEALTRTFVFPFRTPQCCRCCCWDVSSLAPPITVELNDAPVDGTDHTAVGLQSWGSAIVFAERMCSDPERYLGALHPCASIPTITAAITKDAKTEVTAHPRRLIELGAGTGLLSITAAQILSRMAVQAKIKATDYHPSVLENLVQNVRHNHSAVGVFVEKLDWCAVPCTEGASDHAGVDQCKDGGMYDVVLAADVVYHPEHASWIRGCVGRTLKKSGVFWLIIPVRAIGRHAELGKTVEEAFPAVGGMGERMGDREGERERLAIVHREEVERMDGVGRADEGGYTLFEIRWVAD